MESEKFVTAFNNGYILARYEPKLLNSITRGLSPTNIYLEGLFAGKNQFELDICKDQFFELLRLRERSQYKQNDFEKDR